MITTALLVLAVFFAAVLIDIFYVLWFRFSARNWEHRAALMSMLCNGAGLLGAWMIISSNGSEWFAIPDLLGLYLGTILGLRFGRWLEKRWENELSEKEQKLKKLQADMVELRRELKELRVQGKQAVPLPKRLPKRGKPV